MTFNNIVHLAAVAALCLSALPAVAAESTWSEQYYNPAPAKDDLVLAMPCGGKMTFRPVSVPAEGILGDRRLSLGGVDDRYGYAESRWDGFLAGTFDDHDAPGRRIYYIGKYEVTRDQHRSLDAASGTCPAASNPGRLPSTQMAWIDAIGLASRYTEWLLANHPDNLPHQQGVPGFLRLPTEEEWEYAARGGAAVGESDFIAPVFPMQGEIGDYVWYGGTESSNYKLQLIGLKKPNPLGLYDILGNAAELVLEPYRLNKLARFHGQAGGTVVKGGHYFTARDEIRTAAREELPPFDESGLRRLETVGFRLVISSQVIINPERLGRIKREWASLPETESPLADSRRLADPIEEVQALADATTDPRFKSRLSDLKTVIGANIATRNQQRDRALRSNLRLGSLQLVRVKDAMDVVEIREEGFDIFVKKLGAADRQTLEAKAKLESARANLATDIGHYRDILAELVQDYPTGATDEQIPVLVEELKQRGWDNVLPYLEIVRQHSPIIRRTGELSSSAISDSLR